MSPRQVSLLITSSYAGSVRTLHPIELSVLIVERDKIDWKIDEPWNGLGMRGNNSCPVIFNGVVPKANLVGEEHALMKDHGGKFLPVVISTYAAVYLGSLPGRSRRPSGFSSTATMRASLGSIIL